MFVLHAAVLSVSFALAATAASKRDFFSADRGPQAPFPGPPPPPHGPNDFPSSSDASIYQVLSANPHFSKLIKIVNLSDDIVSLLNDSSAAITFFAPTNHALEPPHHSKPHPPHPPPHRAPPHHPLSSAMEDISEKNEIELSPYSLSELLPLVENLATSTADDPDKEKRKKWLAKVIKAIALYHVLPSVLDASALGSNTTFASNLTLIEGQSLRVRVHRNLFPPVLNVNLFSAVVKEDITAGNGVIHAISHPLIPPPAVFTGLFNFPSTFSTLTSALQRTGLTSALDLKYVPGKDGEKGTLEGTTAVSFFAPTNKAFSKLPPRLRAILFSPFGENALRKLLQYHIVPGGIVHSDYLYNISAVDYQLESTSSHDSAQPPKHGHKHHGHKKDKLIQLLAADAGVHLHEQSDDKPHRPPHSHFPHLPHPKLVYATNLTLPTLLSNATLHVHVAQVELPSHFHKLYHTRVSVNGRHVPLTDLVSVNGAVHVIDRLIVPRHPKREHREEQHKKPSVESEGFSYGDGEWNGWENWFMQWVDEQM